MLQQVAVVHLAKPERAVRTGRRSELIESSNALPTFTAAEENPTGKHGIERDKPEAVKSGFFELPYEKKVCND